MIDKIILGNDTALNNKYRENVGDIRDEIRKLIDADEQRGLTTSYIALDDPDTMGQLGVQPVPPNSDYSAKIAVDAIWARYQPDYIVLLGGPDIIPHQDLINPIHDSNDEDRFVASDLPYACNTSFSRCIADFRCPGRVVARLPDVTNVRNPSNFVKVLQAAQNATTLMHDDYRPHFGVSADLLHQSTNSSLSALFGPCSIAERVLPKRDTDWTLDLVQRRTHFFNCHGIRSTPQYFGDGADAHDPALIDGKLRSGTVMSAECCYGAQLYDPAEASGQLSMANVYMTNGAHGFFGSTTVSYGPQASNEHADLICRFFLEAVLSGCSIGRAALLARLAYLRTHRVMTSMSLKTLAQFIVLGDAATHCVPRSTPEDDFASRHAIADLSNEETERLSRKERRKALLREANISQSITGYADNVVTPDAAIQGSLENIATELEISAPSYVSQEIRRPPASGLDNVFGLDTQHPDLTHFHLIFEHDPAKSTTQRRVVEIGEVKGKIVFAREMFRR